MERLNLLDVPTVRGYRVIELWHGDICHPPESVDVLLISAIEGSYLPTSSSVIGALEREHSVIVSQLASCPSLRLESLNTWMAFSGARSRLPASSV